MMEEDPTKNQLYQTCNSSPANGGGECTHANVLHAFGSWGWEGLYHCPSQTLEECHNQSF